MTGARASWLLARLTVRRSLRGRTLWVALALTLLPLVYAALVVERGTAGDRAWPDVFDKARLLLALIPPLFFASVIAEEVDDRTFTYLWSRPLPRWSVLSGKMLGLLPVVSAVLALSLVVPYAWVGGGDPAPLLRAAGAMALGAVAVGSVSAGIGSLVTKQATAGAVMYVFFDFAVGEVPFTIRNLSITHQVGRVAGVGDGAVGTALAWLAGISALWLVIAIWRVSVSEYSRQ